MKKTTMVILFSLVGILGVLAGYFVYDMTHKEEPKKEEIKDSNPVENDGCDKYKTYTSDSEDNNLMYKTCTLGDKKTLTIIDNNFTSGFDGAKNTTENDFEKYGTNFALYLYYYLLNGSKYSDVYRSRILEEYFAVSDGNDICIKKSLLDETSKQLFGEELSDTEWWDTEKEYFSNNYFCITASKFVYHDGIPTVSMVERNIGPEKAYIVVNITSPTNEVSKLKVNFNVKDSYYVYDSYEIVNN